MKRWVAAVLLVLLCFSPAHAQSPPVPPADLTLPAGTPPPPPRVVNAAPVFAPVPGSEAQPAASAPKTRRDARPTQSSMQAQPLVPVLLLLLAAFAFIVPVKMRAVDAKRRSAVYKRVAQHDTQPTKIWEI